MVPREHIIENPLSREQITIRRTAADTGGSVLEWELLLAPGGRVPSSHAHPGQEEVFTVLDGQMRFRVGVRRVIASPGDTVRIPPRDRAPFRERRKPARPGGRADQPGPEHAGTAGDRRGAGAGSARRGPAPAQAGRPGAVHARFRA